MADDRHGVLGVKQQVMIILLTTTFLLITQAPLAASERDPTVTRNSSNPNVFYYVWNTTSLKTEGKCLKFHPANESRLFFMWPEENMHPKFHYCCSVDSETLQSYVYHQHGPPIQVGQYFDLIIVEQCMPYWRCWKSEPVNNERAQNVQIFYVWCEVNDLRRLYSHRFWILAVLKCGVLMSALPLIALLEFGVFLVTLLLSSCGCTTCPWRNIFTSWWRTIKMVKFRSWVHLSLLTLIGNCFMESIAHSDVYTWEAQMLYSFALVYMILPLAVWTAAFVQQVTDWRLMDMYCNMSKGPCLQEDDQTMQQLRSEFEDDDWKWQPIFFQLATLSILGFYCRYGADKSRTEFVSLTLGLAVVASTWSALVAVIVFFRKLNVLRKSKSYRTCSQRREMANPRLRQQVSVVAN